MTLLCETCIQRSLKECQKDSTVKIARAQVSDEALNDPRYPEIKYNFDLIKQRAEETARKRGCSNMNS